MLTRRSILGATLAAAPSAACQHDLGTCSATWAPGPDAPYAVQEIYPALHRGAIWIAGGFSPQEGGATERVIAFDIGENRWGDAPPLPTPSHHVQLIALHGELYAIGGFLGESDRAHWTCTSRVLKLSGETWTEMSPLPKPMAESISVVHGDQIHLIGGRTPRGAANAGWSDHTDIGDHFVFSPNHGWRSAAPLPIARNSAAGINDGARIHVISGRTTDGTAISAHDIYDPRTERWSSGPTFFDARGGLAAALWKGNIVAGGGELLQQRSVANALYALNGESWTQIATMPTPRHGHGLVAVGDALYALGGSRQIATFEPLARLDVLR